MGLFDSVSGGLGQLLGGQGGEGANPALQMVSALMSNSGGLSGLLQQLQQGGLADAVQSWIGTGANQPVNGDQLQQALGSNVIGELAAKLGVQPQQAAQELSQALPQVVDKLTPNGQLPAEGDLASLAQGMLGKLFG